MNNFKNETGYTKHGRKQVQHAAPLPPRPQLVRPLLSRQQDPLLANAAHPAPAISPKMEVPPPAPRPLATAPLVSAPPPVSTAAPAPPVSTTIAAPPISTTSAAPCGPDGSSAPVTPSPSPPPPAAAPAAVDHEEASPVAAPVVDLHLPLVSNSQGEPPPPG